MVLQRGHIQADSLICWQVLWRALRGELKLGKYGAVEALRQGYSSCGECFRIKLPGRSVTFLIGPEACKAWFDGKNTVLNPGGAYRRSASPPPPPGLPVRCHTVMRCAARPQLHEAGLRAARGVRRAVGDPPRDPRPWILVHGLKMDNNDFTVGFPYGCSADP
jgi:hypothetical protein